MSPKELFLTKEKLASQHHDIVVSQSFLEASYAALLQYVMDLESASNPEACAAAYNRIIGARDYLARLSTIGDKPKPPDKKPAVGNLQTNK